MYLRYNRGQIVDAFDKQQLVTSGAALLVSGGMASTTQLFSRTMPTALPAG